MHVTLVGIAGGSASGKTRLARRLQERLGDRALRLSLDRFYRDLSHLAPGRRGRVNFDHPRAIDRAAFEAVLQTLRAGHPASLPGYNFGTHCRLDRPEECPPRPIVLVEGLWLWRRAGERDHFDLRVFLDCSPELQLTRRLKRDVRERGRDPGSVRRQFYEHVLPMQRRFVEPQRAQADLVLRSPMQPGEEDTLMDRILLLLERKSGTSNHR